VGVTPQVLAQAIRDAVDVYGVHIINVSLGIKKDAPEVREAVSYAQAQGVLVVCAVGNDGPNGAPYYPAAYSTVLGVGSHDEGGAVSDFSHQNGTADNRLKIHLPRTQLNGIDGFTGEFWAIEGQQAGRQGQDQCQYQQQTVAPHVPPKPEEQCTHIQLRPFKTPLIAADFTAGQPPAADEIGIAGQYIPSIPSPIWVWAIIRYSSQVSINSSCLPIPST